MNLLPGLQWTAPVGIIVGRQISEIDMKSAGLTVIRSDRLLSEKVIEYLEQLPKNEVSVVIGKMSRQAEFRGLSQKITNGIRTRLEDFVY